MGRRKKKKTEQEQVYFCLDKRYRSRFPHSPRPCSQPEASPRRALSGVGGRQPLLTQRPNASPPPAAAGRTAVFLTACHTGERPPPAPGRAAPRPRCRATTAPAGNGGQRHGTAAPGPPAARGRRAAASVSPSPAAPQPAQGPATGPLLLTCPQRRPVIVAAGGGLTPAVASCASPSASAAALPLPLPAPAGGGTGDAPPRRHLGTARGGA